MAAGIEEACKKHRKFWNDFFNIQAQIIQTIQNIYLLLDECEGNFSFNNNEIVFDNNLDVERYNNFIIKLTDLSAKEELLNQERIKK